MKHPLDSFLEYLEKNTDEDKCVLCGGTGELEYAGRFVRSFMDTCHLCNGTGKREAFKCLTE